MNVIDIVTMIWVGIMGVAVILIMLKYPAGRITRLAGPRGRMAPAAAPRAPRAPPHAVQRIAIKGRRPCLRTR